MAGVTSVGRDSVDAVTNRLPWVLGLLVAITFELLFGLHRKRGAVGEVADVQCSVTDYSVWRAGVDLPGRSSRRVGSNPERDAGDQHAGVVVLHRVWIVHRLFQCS